MRIVIVGAYGLLGRFIAARLAREGHELVGVGREVAAPRRQFPGMDWVAADMRRLEVSQWCDILRGADAVVNCAGALQDSPRDDLQAVHVRAVAGMAEACVSESVRRFIQISAVGVDTGGGRFDRTKADAEDLLRTTSLDWVVLRPGLVLAPAAYGGSALLRGLAGFPGFIPAVAPHSPVQTVAVEDVAEAVSRCLREGAPSRIACDLVAAETTSLKDVLRALRAWLGFPDGPVVEAPRWSARLCGRAADGLALLGWRSPLRTAAVQRLLAGVEGRSGEACELLGFAPRSLAATLRQWPSGVQERWFARLYFVKPLALMALAAFWAVSGGLGLAGREGAAGLLTNAGFPAPLAWTAVLAGSVADLALAGLVCFRRTAPLALKCMILMTAAYLIGATVWLPQLWADPLGPLVKSIPAAILALAALALMDER